MINLALGPLITKSASLGPGAFEGVAASYTGAPDRQGDLLERGAFKRTLKAWQQRGARVPLLWNHDSAEPIGALTVIDDSPTGLLVRGQLAVPEVPMARRAAALMLVGGLSLSIGAAVPPGGAELRHDGVRLLRQLELLEVSAVAVPADAGAVISAAKSLTGPRELQDVQRAYLGLSKRQAERLVSGGWQALSRGDDDEPDTDSRAIADLVAILERSTQSLRRK